MLGATQRQHAFERVALEGHVPKVDAEAQCIGRRAEQRRLLEACQDERWAPRTDQLGGEPCSARQADSLDEAHALTLAQGSHRLRQVAVSALREDGHGASVVRPKRQKPHSPAKERVADSRGDDEGAAVSLAHSFAILRSEV